MTMRALDNGVKIGGQFIAIKRFGKISIGTSVKCDNLINNATVS